MASSKRLFAGRLYAGRLFAPALFRGVSAGSTVVPITDIGLEWTLLKAPGRIEIGAKMERIELKAPRRIEVRG